MTRVRVRVAGAWVDLTRGPKGDTGATGATGGVGPAGPPGGPEVLNPQTGTSYTLVLTDAEKFVTMTNVAASTLTVPPNSAVAFPVGTIVKGSQSGAGQLTLVAGAGVTVNGAPGLKLASQYGVFALLKTATDTWLAFGRLSA